MKTYPPQIQVRPVPGPFDRELRLPGSKSLTNRALLLAALAQGDSVVRRPLVADDTQRMMEALVKLGVMLHSDGGEVAVHGCGGPFPARQAELFLGNAGTAMRSLTAAVALGDGVFTLRGIPRMHERPIGELVDPLRRLGAGIACLEDDGFPPLRISARGLFGRELTMKPTLSSQFISALLMAAPLMEGGLTLRFEGPVTSRSYVELTLGLMQRFGVAAEVDAGFARIRVEPGMYVGHAYTVEPDAGSASYFLAPAAAIPGSRVTVLDLGRSSLQGEAGLVEVLRQMGAQVDQDDSRTSVSYAQPLRGIDIDMSSMPDTAMTLATLAVLADGPTTIRNVGNWRVKETDRMAAMQVELSKLGAKVTVSGGDITVTPPPGGRVTPATIDTYDDHRMAMSFALIGLAQPGITINDPGCVAKTFPRFFDVLDELHPAAGAAV